MVNQVHRLSDVINLIGGGTPKRSISEYWNGDIPWLSVKDFNHGGRYVEESDETITNLGLEKSSTKLLQPGMLIISARGTVGELAQLKCEMAFNQSCYGIDAKTHHLDNDYLYYLLKLKIRELKSIAHGSVFDTITRDTFENIEVEIPIKHDQKAIAHILGTLDDKIELNQKMNQTLEEIAKAIFKSWFVDFDPVRAKAEGRPTGLPPEISDLFPDELVDSEIGEIPKGWDLVPLGDHTELTKGRSYKSAELMDSDTALVTLKSFKRGGGYRLDGLKPYVGTFKPEQVVVEGELIIALTDVTQAADVIGKPAIVRSSSKHTKLVASLDVGIVRANESSLLTKEFCYFLMLSERYTQHSLGYTSGTTVLHLAKDASAKFEVSIPPAGLVNRFSEIVSNLMKRIFVAEKESETLSELRDTLLPKLISGELRIPDAEKFLEEAGI